MRKILETHPPRNRDPGGHMSLEVDCRYVSYLPDVLIASGALWFLIRVIEPPRREFPSGRKLQNETAMPERDSVLKRPVVLKDERVVLLHVFVPDHAAGIR